MHCSRGNGRGLPVKGFLSRTTVAGAGARKASPNPLPRDLYEGGG